MLTANELSTLRSFVDVGDRIAYYEQLNEYGYSYGGLALGVVNHNTFAGKVANEFFIRVANIERARSGLPELTNQQLAEVSIRLMEADFEAREVAGNYFNGGARLTVSAVRDYHEDVFRVFGVSIAAWTPAFALETLNSVGAREELWSSYLGGGGNDLTVLAAFGSYNGIPGAIANGPAPYDGEAYLSFLAGAGARATVGSSHEYGDYSVGLGGVIQGASGLVLGGTEDDDALGSAIVTGGVRSTDVIMGFDGDDGLQGLGAADTLYGGRGDDTLYASGEDDWLDDTQGDDSLRGGRGRDELHLGGGDRGQAGSGNDVVRLSTASFAEAAWLAGGAGRDVLDLSESEDAISVGVEAETDEDEEFDEDGNGLTYVLSTDGGRASHRATGFEYLASGDGADTIDLRGGPDGYDPDLPGTTRFFVHGGGGADEVYGSDGDDVLMTGTGNGEDNLLEAGGGDDVVIATPILDEGSEREYYYGLDLNGGGGDDLYLVSFAMDRGIGGVTITDEDMSGSILVGYEDEAGWQVDDVSSFTRVDETITEGNTHFISVFSSSSTDLYFSFVTSWEGQVEPPLHDLSAPPTREYLEGGSYGGSVWSTPDGNLGWAIGLYRSVNGRDAIGTIGNVSGFPSGDDEFVGRIRLDGLSVEGFAVGGQSGVTATVDGVLAELSGARFGDTPLTVALDGSWEAPLDDTGEEQRGGDGIDRMAGGDFDDSLAGGGGADYLEGGAGDDVLYGDAAPIDWGVA